MPDSTHTIEDNITLLKGLPPQKVIKDYVTNRQLCRSISTDYLVFSINFFTT